MRAAILGIVFLTILYSCETMFQHTYVVKNATNHKIEIKGFDKVEYAEIVNDSVNYTSEVIVIELDSEYRNIQEAGYHPENQGIFNYWGIDSITIIFDSLKIIFYACNHPDGKDCNDKYNLMNYEDNFTKRKTGRELFKNEYTFTYTITEDDYDFAQWIE